MTKRPKVTVGCVAGRYARPTQRIIEAVFPSGRGCLISLDTDKEGRDVIMVYRADKGIEISGPWGEDGQKLEPIRFDVPEDQSEDPPACPLCGEESAPLGALGARRHFRCRDCGADHSQGGEDRHV